MAEDERKAIGEARMRAAVELVGAAMTHRQDRAEGRSSDDVLSVAVETLIPQLYGPPGKPGLIDGTVTLLRLVDMAVNTAATAKGWGRDKAWRLISRTALEMHGGGAPPRVP